MRATYISETFQRRQGGFINHHRSHQNGRDVDIGMYAKGNRLLDTFMPMNEANLDVAKTWCFVENLLRTQRVQYIFLDRRVQQLLYDYAASRGVDETYLNRLFGNSKGAIIQHVVKHQDHMHVRFYTPWSTLASRVGEMEAQKLMVIELAQQAYLPKKVNYYVQGTQRGLDALAQSFGVTRRDLCRWNGVYLDKAGDAPQAITMGVIIQEMVAAQLSGVAFRRNPITALDDIVIEAVPGSGIALVQEGMTPSRWVNKWGRWIEQSNPDKVPAGLAQAIVDGTKHIAQVFRADVDLEWAWDGESLYWLQMRDITSIRDMRIYTNRISKEILPGVIKPLVWSVNVPMTTDEWVRLLAEIVSLDHI